MRLLLFFFLLLSTVTASADKQQPGDFTVGNKTFLLNGKPFVVKAAELHYPRIPRPYWEHRIQMCKALGMNTICMYVFWNIHEQREGEFDFSGNSDIAEFVRLCQKNGMYVIVRPGPYVCAEWEMGGLPWWLLKKKDIRLRECDPYFMERVRIFEQKVGEQLTSLTIQHGGPVIMIQVENEYGSYGVDKPYVSEIRDCLRGIYGKEMLLFQCDWASNFEMNGLDDLVWTMNFGTGANINQQFKRLSELRPTSPLMCSEFWSGWFDKWGARHETRPAEDMVAGLDEMLSKNISFSLYMTHGGTSFGHWAGANSPGFSPDVTSYDYDAPINEYGMPTRKYWLLREMMAKYNDDKRLPAVPKAPLPVITVPRFELTEYQPLLMGGAGEDEGHIMTFEEADMGWGMMLYSTTLPEIPVKSVLKAEVHDYAQVFIDGKYVGKIDRTKDERSLLLPAVRKDAVIDILVEGMGRINFGRSIKDNKGIVGQLTLSAAVDNIEMTWSPRIWNNVIIPDSYDNAVRALSYSPVKTAIPDDLHIGRGYYRGAFTLKKVGDTFLNFETWGKGQVYVNGHAIGRFWSIGPQQTLYVPGCWLKKGENEIIVLDIVGPQEPVVWGQAKPEQDKLQMEKSNKHNDSNNKPDLNAKSPVFIGQLKPGNGWQTVNFQNDAKGRYLAIEVLSTHRGDAQAAIAELYLQTPGGRRISREMWTVVYADSEDDNGNHLGDKVFDLQESTYWQTERGATLPHLLIIDLGTEETISGLEYLPRVEQDASDGVKDVKIYVY
ncbi:MAG: beta-galactosidase [Prevotella sp.]|nr:beta-galactosidase [Prevotella sp.]